MSATVQQIITLTIKQKRLDVQSLYTKFDLVDCFL